MAFLSLPNELLLEIVSYLPSEKDLSALTVANRRSHCLFIDMLYQRNVEHANSSSLVWAIANRQESVAQKAIFAGADVDMEYDDEVSITGLAIWLDDERLVRLLVDNGVDVNSHCTANGQDLLTYATSHGREAIARFLLNRGADANRKPDIDGHAPLHFATTGRFANVTRLLLEHGADPNVQSRAGVTPLHEAAVAGDHLSVRALRDHGANPDQTCNDGFTALHLAAKVGYAHVVAELLQFSPPPNINYPNERDGRTALYYAAVHGNVEVVRRLLGGMQEAHVNVQD